MTEAISPPADEPLARSPRRTGLPRVLHVARPLRGGVPRYLGALAADQVGRGWTVCVACPPESDTVAAVTPTGARVIAWPATRSPGPSLPGELRRLARILAAEDPDVVHLHAAKAGLAGRLALRGARPTIVQPHAWSFEAGGPSAALARRWERLSARWAHLVICVSDDERRRGAVAGIRPPRLEVVPNGVDLAAFPPCDASARTVARTALGLRREGPLAVCVGRIGAQKNQGLLVDVWPRVRAAVPAAELVLVGDGPEETALAVRGVPGVTLVGHRSDVGRWLAAASVVVQPSLWEGMSLIVLEAQASARSVVVFEAGGMRDAVGPGAGAVIPVADVGGLVSALVTRLADQGLADKEGATGRAHVEARFDMRATLAAVASLSESLAAARGRREDRLPA